ncbi:hypothetical protein GPOL_c33690 [Gordonia polyisoprenivorans VH2]|uniref:Uncharacterized protein n=1 Tax=Gordonia polyisoprenivorans (strain DSM 44266 / VH2) TaxID=1112204 RepID=H6MZ45_GORPV|nr:hypothetical protein GPOL_c33690 [Gordonia polyisoprenivorans VH2]
MITTRMMRPSASGSVREILPPRCVSSGHGLSSNRRTRWPSSRSPTVQARDADLPMVEVRAACGEPRDPTRHIASQPHPPTTAKDAPQSHPHRRRIFASPPPKPVVHKHLPFHRTVEHPCHTPYVRVGWSHHTDQPLGRGPMIDTTEAPDAEAVFAGIVSQLSDLQWNSEMTGPQALAQ